MPVSSLFAVLLVLLGAAPALAETHEVKMLNRGATGAMVYEPDYLAIAPGDKVKFIATHSTHNAASIPGFLPAAAEPFKGRIDEELEVSFSEPGLYGIQCIPHLAMGMVMLIQVGAQPASEAQIPAQLPARARQRFEQIVQRATQIP
ncbi:pseudoazurin [Phytopseudomonas dryadis]|uniref:Pseudoazurin n=1 Tax=Phytopseudomonas dryadis TaxID=2487520 RepID=A0A4V2KBL5_9GAMM|nr:MULTISPECIES: pseudoazurin [Pseudomonas]TBU87031.1 pseudoazurin [Pseudomonas dryadis]TBV02115.1 pseudoazurin [Pseudomonas dryadis]TBV14865.1 pseudoazurin [Pseudomonas sp. FRB 230]